MRSTPYGRSLSSRKENLYLGSFHVRFLFGRRLTVNVFRQRINQLFQGVGIFGGGLRSIPCGRLRSTPYGRSRRTSNLETVRGGDRESIPGLKAQVG
ncbi:hypothetical protein [Cylindrospermopsis curvispora]|uniref:hypothetical protein n=1 Tax=Cylindrospermopsis curvispora TaxID=747548 RepID=UPI001F39DFA9|nr:hypothetical protein [Cylindrospermopsis curvispora]